MSSVNAKAVAHEVVEMIVKGQKVNHRSLLKKHGYSQSIADRPDKVTKTKSYMDIVNPVLKKMENVRRNALLALEQKDMKQEKVMTLISTVDVMTKNAQLLGGRATENIGINISISEQIANKYKDMSSDTDTKKE